MGSALETGGRKGNKSVSEMRAERNRELDKVVRPVILPFGFAKNVWSDGWLTDADLGPEEEGRLR
jgi:hypothetical protein